jgi:hypothetical protein
MNRFLKGPESIWDCSNFEASVFDFESRLDTPCLRHPPINTFFLRAKPGLPVLTCVRPTYEKIILSGGFRIGAHGQ